MNLNPRYKYLFDTSVFIDLLRKRPEGKNLVFQAHRLRIPVGYSIITETELWVGITGKWTEHEHKLVLRPFTRYFVNVTIARNTGHFYRETRQKGVGLADCLIAATAHYYDLRICTRNEKHFKYFKKFGVEIDAYAT